MEGSNTIRSLSKECFYLFNQHCEALKNDGSEPAKDGLQDEFARFKLWFYNTGVFAEVQLSLDFRLREMPDIRGLFLSHLDTIYCRLTQRMPS